MKLVFICIYFQKKRKARLLHNNFWHTEIAAVKLTEYIQEIAELLKVIWRLPYNSNLY